MSDPFFSVIIATYNRARLLQNALDSLISQTTDDWEAIIVDDESNDDTYSQILPYLRSYKQIRYFRKTHSGCAMSKNAGICLSAGKFITFLDSDDEYEMIHLESRKRILKEHPSIQFLHGGVKIIGNQFVPDRFDYEKSVNLSDCVIGGTFFIERDTMFRLKGFRKISLGEDADLYERAKNSGISIKATNFPTYIYHHETDDSITNRLHRESTLKRRNQAVSVG
ncbi:MAG TPA: glycosyltransferase family 2 protein [Bacteroidales bacterium]|nr:glycosyltransferase family 2 protein [Bacteroidales bacterium]